jgi:hypothetical protein
MNEEAIEVEVPAVLEVNNEVTEAVTGEVDSTENNEAVADAVEKSATASNTVSQEEFNKLYFQLKQAERERDAAQSAKESKKEVSAPKVAPTLEDFDFDDDKFNAAAFEFKVAEQVAAALEVQKQHSVQEKIAAAKQEVAQTFNQRAVEYAAKNPSYEQAIAAAGSEAVFSSHIQEVVLQSEVGPAIDHKLLSDPALLHKLNTMNTTQAIMELARIEASLTSASPTAKATAPVKVSNAPEPIETVGGGGRASDDYAYNENMDMADYYAAHQAKLKSAKR